MKQIQSQEQANELLDCYCHFHDTILKEIKILNSEYVDSDGRAHLNPSGYQFDATFLFHANGVEVKALRLFFEQIERFNLVGAPVNCSTELWVARINVCKDSIYFMADVDASVPNDWLPKDNDGCDIIWISSRILRWEFVDDCFGPRIELPFRSQLER
jgi:hypothetical protein